jgi:hypothetical protein
MEKKMISKAIRFFSLLCILLNLFSLNLQAQDVKAKARLDTTKIMIGDHVKLELLLERPAKLKVTFPLIPDSLTKIEIINRSKIDTIASADKSLITERQVLTITSFDSGHYPVPPFKFVIGNDTSKFVETEAMLLSVYAPKVDTTQAIKEIKGPMDIPFSYKEIIPYALGGLALLAILIAVWYYLKNRKKKPEEIVVKIPERPAHEIALEALSNLEKEKVWQTQNNGVKNYHSQLSDIVRTYIELRYKIPAMELTTDEILNNFKRSSMSEELKGYLKQLLELSDLVKFAKAQPLPHEHEMSLAHAYDFVKGTIPQQKSPKDGKESLT